MPQMVLYTTSVPVTMKLKHEILRVKRLLDGRKIAYEEVDIAMDVERRQEMATDEKGVKVLPQLHIDGKFVGTAEDLWELEEMGELESVLKGES